MDLSDERERLNLARCLQVTLREKHGEDDYNVFCFGSFLTKGFRAGKSDIDLAVYCEDKMKLIDIQCTIEDTLSKLAPELSLHLMAVELLPYRFVNLDILIEGVQFTDYFPEYITTYLCRLKRELRHHNERMEHRRFVIMVNECFSNVSLPNNI